MAHISRGLQLPDLAIVGHRGINSLHAPWALSSPPHPSAAFHYVYVLPQIPTSPRPCRAKPLCGCTESGSPPLRHEGVRLCGGARTRPLLRSELSRGTIASVIQSLKISWAKGARAAKASNSPDAAIWQKRYYDRNVCDHLEYVEKLKYSRRNPARRNLVEKPEGWRWSSFRHCANVEDYGVAIKSWRDRTLTADRTIVNCGRLRAPRRAALLNRKQGWMMRALTQKQNEGCKSMCSSLARPGAATGVGDSREHPMLQAQHAFGNRAVQRMLRSLVERPGAQLTTAASPRWACDFGRMPLAGAIQSKATLNAPGDEHEQEADRIAEQVVGPERHLQCACACGGTCAENQVEQPAHAEQRLSIRRAAAGGCDQVEVAPIVHEVLRAPGRPLDPVTRRFMERRFGHDFGQVRVHTGEPAEMSARAINADAYTVGNDIVFGRGTFDFNGAEGRRLLAHELTHVVQQSAAGASKSAGLLQRKTICHTGCGQRWGQDTTCSMLGFQEGILEREPQFVIEVVGKGKQRRIKTTPCCNSWPFSVEKFAREHLGLSGAASCNSAHAGEIATVTLGDKAVKVLCSDTIPPASFGERASAAACAGKISQEVIELSPNAMQELSNQLNNAVHVKVCYSGAKQDLCWSNSSNPKKFPEVENCLTDGCVPSRGTPKLKDTGWRST